MSDFLYSLAFHRSGKPRGWLRKILFDHNMVVRPVMRRVVYKKSGKIRPRYEFWVKNYAGQDYPAFSPAAPEAGDALLPAEIVLRDVRSLREAATYWVRTSPPEDLMDAPALMAMLGTSSASRLLIGIGHDNYRAEVGGVQLCVHHEELIAERNGYDYLYMYPFQAQPILADEGTDPAVELLLGGKPMGAARMSDLLKAVRSETRRREVRVAIHHLLGHSPELVADMVQASGHPCVLWLHDYFTICPNYTLRRNTLAFCYAPDLDSNSCEFCVFGRDRQEHDPRMKRFFSKVDVDVVSPSGFTADLWRMRSGLPSRSLSVIPHVVLEEGSSSAAPLKATDAPITIAYLGAPYEHKGWDVFRRLMAEHGDNSRFRFVVMSRKRPGLGEHAWYPVRVTAQDSEAMARAVREADVDVVLHWPSWPETFSFTTFEAMSGLAFVLTNDQSGNIAAVVAATGRGEVLADTADLDAFLADGRMDMLVARRRARAAETNVTPRVSDMSLSLLPRN